MKIFIQALAEQTSQQYYQSVTVIKSSLEKFMTEGDEACNSENIAYALYSYMEAEKLLKKHSEVFTRNEKKEMIEKIKIFYDRYSDCYEHRETWREWIKLTKQAKDSNYIEQARCYHGLAYSFEKYHYYKLFLKAMLKAEEMKIKIYRTVAYIYIGVGYAYLKNGNHTKAKIWYEKAEKIKDFSNMEEDAQAFIYNGLYRYYENIQNKFEQAVETLDKALEMRKKLYNAKIHDHSIVVHLINTYSNRIRLYLSHGKIDEAEKEYNNFLAEPDIWKRLNDDLFLKIRILSDFGDILMTRGKYRESYDKYVKALNYRRELSLTEDIIIAELYLKIADSIKNIESESRWTIEYMIQTYLIKKKVLGNKNLTVQKLYEEIMNLRMKQNDTEEIMLKRISVQERFSGYHYDEDMNKREDELITFFNLS